MIDYETSKRPKRPGEWLALLEAVFNADPKDEFDWIEWKSEVNWSNRVELGTNVARHMLGFANRTMPSDRLDGYGLLIIGMEPGKVIGVQPLDPAILDEKLLPFLGHEGPGWTPHWWTVQGKNVLTIEVPPPAAGQPIYSLMAIAAKYTVGSVFVRVKGHTIRAEQTHLNAMAIRYASNAPTDIDVSVWSESEPLARYGWQESHVEAFLEAERSRLMKQVEDYEARLRAADEGLRGVNSFVLSAMDQRGPGGEERTREQFTDQVEQYLQATRKRLPLALLEIGAAILPAPTFLVTNNTGLNYKKLRVDMHIEGEVDGRDKRERVPLLESLLPKPPVKYGRTRLERALIGEVFEPRSLNIASIASKNSRREVTNGGGVNVKFNELDLRAHEERMTLDSDLALLVPHTRKEPLIATWKATTSNVNARAIGTFEIPVKVEAVDLLVVAQKLGKRQKS